MKILYYTDSFRLGGKERQLVELFKGLKRNADVELLVVCMDRGEFFERDAKDLNVHIRFLPRMMRWDPFVLIHLYKLFAEFRPDIVHTNSFMTSAYALPLTRAFGIPLINGLIRNAFNVTGMRGKLERAVLRWSDYRVANSLAGLHSRGLSSRSGKDSVIYNGIDLNRFAFSGQGQVAPAISSSNCGHVVGMVAEFRKDKDYATFIRTALRVLDTRKNVRFLTVGDGPTLEECQRLVPKECDRIIFAGRRKDDVEKIISAFSIGVLATFTEGIPNFIMECMALGKPVVVSDGGGSRELVLDGKTGFLVPPGDPAALAEKIEFLLDNPDIANSMGQAGRERIERDFPLTKMIDETLTLYQRALNGGTSKHAPSDRARI
jgi:glycosyltransferase involved in cell wall biosynthesis